MSEPKKNIVINETFIANAFNKPDFPVRVEKGQMITLLVDDKIIYSFPVDTDNAYYVQLMPVLLELEDKIRMLYERFDEGESMLAIRQIVITRTKKDTKPKETKP